IAIIRADLPIPALLQRGAPRSHADDPRRVSARKLSWRSSRAGRSTVVDRNAIDGTTIKPEVLDVLAPDGDRHGFKSTVVDLPGESQRSKLRGEAKVLELIDRAEIVTRIWYD